MKNCFYPAKGHLESLIPKFPVFYSFFFVVVVVVFSFLRKKCLVDSVDPIRLFLCSLIRVYTICQYLCLLMVYTLLEKMPKFRNCVICTGFFWVKNQDKAGFPVGQNCFTCPFWIYLNKTRKRRRCHGQLLLW